MFLWLSMLLGGVYKAIGLPDSLVITQLSEMSAQVSTDLLEGREYFLVFLENSSMLQ